MILGYSHLSPSISIWLNLFCSQSALLSSCAKMQFQPVCAELVFLFFSFSVWRGGGAQEDHKNAKKESTLKDRINNIRTQSIPAKVEPISHEPNFDEASGEHAERLTSH